MVTVDISDQICSELTEDYYSERGIPKAVNGTQLGMMALALAGRRSSFREGG